MNSTVYRNRQFAKALLGEAQAVPPIWFMRQAGRYHRHYQRLREKHSFSELCKGADLAAEVAAGPVEDFDFDVAILFSDILFALEALGFGLEYTDSGPALDRRVLSVADAKALRPADLAIESLAFQGAAMRTTCQRIPSDKSVIGFVGGPWTLFTYASSNRHEGSLIEAKNRRDVAHAFFERAVPLLIKNIGLQLEAGAELVMVFDTAAGALHPLWFAELVAPYIEQFSRQFPGRIGYYGRGLSHDHLDQLREPPLAGFGVDHRFDLPAILRRRESPDRFVQGNFDQELMFLDGAGFRQALHDYLRPFAELSPAERAGWVCGLGHGVLPRTPEENVRSFVHIVRETFSK